MKFYLYTGLAGDYHQLLVGKKNGVKVSRLYNRVAMFKTFRLRRLKKQLMAEYEILTGDTP